ncbi:MAG TPA: hypothetical protein VGN88_06285 [Phycisphaerae bacterium]
MSRRSKLSLLLLLILPLPALAQDKPEDIRILTPVAGKTAHTVQIPGSFWNSHEADWIETALSGRPSDFLHETLLSVTTTRTLLTQSFRDAGFHDADAWVDGVKDFPRIRGDQFLILVNFQNNGKEESYSLDELISFAHWGVSAGPFGFMFKGDPGTTQSPPPDSTPASKNPLPDSALILKDDPQIALEYKGLQSMSQSFADHPLAYLDDDFEWGELNRGRNSSALLAAVYDSNNKIPLRITFQRVTVEELLTQDAKLWHDAPFRDYILKQLDTARQIDKNKSDYWTLRQDLPKFLAIAPELRDAQKQHDIVDRLTLLAADIQRDYSVLDAAWAAWDAGHLKIDTSVETEVAYHKKQSTLWRDFLADKSDQARALSAAAHAAFEQKSLTLTGTSPDDPKIAVLKGAEFESRSRALAAQTRSTAAYWQQKADDFKKQNPTPDSGDIYAQDIALHVALNSARLAAASAGIALGAAQSHPAAQSPEALAQLKKTSDRASLQMFLAESNLDLALTEFEISKRQSITADDPELPQLRATRDQLKTKIASLKAALVP